ncbi:hypothetical protein [Hymenobacter perfusus]|uniref:Uncharacterized protein n=1 Tax=Hymenobacter perfusus TaxID=1236770 RepID=A0A3R9PJC0_9BACT|nr:hypothetical protein [Hymenobacter perfusus]RSK39540.1 hypothetical protein EI293_20180 [Hymenobacter perfusus]
MKKAVYILLAAVGLTSVAPGLSANAATSRVAYSRADYWQGGYDLSREVNIDPSDENKYNLYLTGKSNHDYAVYVGDQSQMDYWQGWLDALGPVVIPY